MSALSIQPTYPIFTDIDGQPLEDGYIWIGTTNLDPQTNPINVYWDAALTLPAAQPIRTLAGYPANSGTPARLYVNSDYSIRVMNKNGSTVYSSPVATERYNDAVVNGVDAQNVVYDPPFVGGVQTNVEARLAQTVSVKDFGAVGDGVADDTTAIQTAINSFGGSGGSVYFPNGTYKITGSLIIPDYIQIFGAGRRISVIKKHFVGSMVSSCGGYVTIKDITFDGNGASFSGRGVVFTTSSQNTTFIDMDIENVTEQCILFSQPDVGALFRAIGCTFYTTATPGTMGAVVVGATDTQATSRHFTNCESGGCTLFDFGGCNDLYVTGGYSNCLLFGNSNCTKVMLTNMRIGAAGGTVTIRGATHQISNCIFAAPVINLSKGTRIDAEVPSYDITDSVATGTNIVLPYKFHTVNWFQDSGVQPAIGDGSLSMIWQRDGFSINVQFRLVVGSTTTFGNGAVAWKFSLPHRAGIASGVQRLQGVTYFDASAPTGNIPCIVEIPAGESNFLIAYNGQAFRDGYPGAWATGDTITASFTYVLI